ncbi:malonyl-ACP O-methyltransferase BioC [Bermanella sp. WJH001]|uniref:malonyl-ACP O-methyltransferase BioC n=1 Tax=Bermanella sp. WJH001 TaxID=3048005 RepID=UPI0024BDA5F6|nr:malonyl-ACP O-methyltransferase BioC [Bermanella sp. WJH001]MDJ1538044.1 malonyl-ACP O-methyltransferase BioC [Bermanella sp. WJH001]
MHDVIPKQAVAKSFSNAAQDYDQFARFQHELAKSLIEMCPEEKKQTILDLGCGTGYCLPLLNQQYTKASLLGADIAPGMLAFAQQQYPEFQYAVADAENLPFAEGQFDLIFSNLAVQWCDDFSQVLIQAYKCLKPGGHFVLSTLADGTLAELKQAWSQVDQHQHVNQFDDENDLKAMLGASLFQIEQLNISTIYDYHKDVRGLTDSLKRIGAHNITDGRAKGLTSPRAVKQFMQAMETHRQEAGLPASYRVLSCCLKKPE